MTEWMIISLWNNNKYFAKKFPSVWIKQIFLKFLERCKAYKSSELDEEEDWIAQKMYRFVTGFNFVLLYVAWREVKKLFSCEIGFLVHGKSRNHNSIEKKVLSVPKRHNSWITANFIND